MSNNVEEIQKAFHKARIAGEQKLKQTKTDAEFNREWEKYMFMMIGFECALQGKGVAF